MPRGSVKVIHAALDETPDREIILRGVIDPESLQMLKIADYQREVMPLTTISKLAKAFESNASVPDIDLGMRGESFVEREQSFYLQDDVYIIDGLQRVSAARHVMKTKPDVKPQLGATIHFNTNEEWERQRFKTLNVDRNKLSPNILIRNLRSSNPAVEMLYHLCHDKTFVMHNRVCWSQRATRDHLISALTLLKATGVLHSHVGPGRTTHLEDLCAGLSSIMDKTGRLVLRDNVKAFFDVIDQCWGISVITFREGATYLRSTFLWCLANIFSKHQVFWHGSRLFIGKDLLRKIKSFPVADPEVRNLSSASGKARELLYQLMLDHINRGKRTQRLGTEEKTDLNPRAGDPDEPAPASLEL